jgi:hypothetical protein
MEAAKICQSLGGNNVPVFFKNLQNLINGGGGC